MKKFFLISCFCFLLFYQGRSQVFSYQPGERVDYLIHYGVISGGLATLELKKEIISGKELWHSVMLARTTGVADAIFKVKDIYESYIDPETELPVRSIRNISEGRYKRYNVVLFDHKTRQDSSILTSDLTGVHITQQGIHDILSCFYWFRNHILPDIDRYRIGDTITIMTWFTDELYPIIMKYYGVDEIKTRAGRLRCYKFNPVTEKGRLFKTKEDMTFWFSADENFLPVKIRFDIFVGAFMVEMTNYEGLKYPLNIKKK